MPPRQSFLQRTRSAAAKRIDKACRWQISRPGRRPRGLANGGQTCYRNAMLQSLLHLPKFINWVMQHNEPGRKWPCLGPEQDSNQREHYRYPDDPTMLALGDQIKGCVPCLLKPIIRSYWSVHEGDNEPKSLRSIDFDDECWHHLHQLAKRWFYREPDNMGALLKQKDNKKKIAAAKAKGEDAKVAAELEIRQAARTRHIYDQQDTVEYLALLLGGIENSYPHRYAPLQPTRCQLEYDSLFTVTRTESWTCQSCRHHRPNHITNEVLGISINPLLRGTDTIPAAIARSMTDTISIACGNCSTAPDDEKTMRKDFAFIALPEYLRVAVYFPAFRPATGDAYKNRNSVAIPQILDMTPYTSWSCESEPVQVRYALRHVVYHQGQELGGGHYAAGITAHPQGKNMESASAVYFCNDTRVVMERAEGDRGASPLLVNLVNRLTEMSTESDYDVYVI